MDALTELRDISRQCWDHAKNMIDMGLKVHFETYKSERTAIRKTLSRLVQWELKAESLLRECESVQGRSNRSEQSGSPVTVESGQYNSAHAAIRWRLEWLIDAIYDCPGLNAELTLAVNEKGSFDLTQNCLEFERSIDPFADAEWIRRVNTMVTALDSRFDLYELIDEEFAAMSLEKFRDLSVQCWEEFAEQVDVDLYEPYPDDLRGIEIRNVRKSLEELRSWQRRCENLFAEWDYVSRRTVQRLLDANVDHLGVHGQNLAHQAARHRLEALVNDVQTKAETGLTAKLYLMPDYPWDFESSIDLKTDVPWLIQMNEFLRSQPKCDELRTQIDAEYTRTRVQERTQPISEDRHDSDSDAPSDLRLEVTYDDLVAICRHMKKPVAQRTIQNRGGFPEHVGRQGKKLLFAYSEVREWWRDQKLELSELPPVEEAASILNSL